MLPVQAQATGKWHCRDLRMLDHSMLPNMFTRSRSATTIGSRVPSAMKGSKVALQCPSAWQVDAPLVHVQKDRSETVLHETDRELGVDRPQELSHFHGSRGAPFFLRCQQRDARVSQRPDGGSATRENAKGPVDLVCMGPARDVEQVCGMLCARASGAGAVRAAYRSPAKGRSNPGVLAVHLRLTVRGNVDARVEVRVGNELARPLPAPSVSHLHHG